MISYRIFFSSNNKYLPLVTNIEKQVLCIRASPRKPRPTSLNRGRQILLNLRYMIEATILRILTQAISKNIYPLIFL